MFKLIATLRVTAVAAALSAAAWGWAAAPAGYYSSCEGKGGATLLTALNAKIGPHTTVSYKNLYTVYKQSDVDAQGKIWDMYSTKRWSVSDPKCGNYSYVGDCYNREHSFPKSWFDDATPMYSDAYHIYPTDGKVNGQRSNFPYGECANGITLPSHGGVDALGKLGKSTFPGYTGTVFEPVDDYKGDFARTYFYMAACYNDKIATWHSDMLASNRYPVFSSWALDLLLKWHRMDPVSDKEIKRNEAVSSFQKNRNPFIDHPEMVEYIWGSKKDSQWTEGAGLDPAIDLPVDGSVIDMGAVGVSVPRTIKVTIKGSDLKDNVTVSVSGSPFSVTPATVTAAAANSAQGAEVTLSCSALSAGQHNGYLYVKSGSLTNTVTLRAAAYTGLPASGPTNISDVSFVAHWTNIGDADANGCYTLTVLDANNEVVDTYPRSATAADEQYFVDELTPSTAYSYYLTTASGIRSNTINVMTAAPIPSIQLLHDGELTLVGYPGEASDAEEVIIDSENIDTNIVISVSAPFEVSTDKNDWSTAISVSPNEDRFYLRVNSATAGVFTTSITATAGEYVNDDAEAIATVSDRITFLEDFEQNAPGGYNEKTPAELAETMGTWSFSEAGVYRVASEAHSGNNYVRTSKKATSVFYLVTPKVNGMGKISFFANAWASGEAGDVEILASIDGGLTWESVSTVNITGAKTYTEYTVTANVPGTVQVKFQQKTGGRLMFDDINITDFKAGIEGVESDYRSWTAYSTGNSNLTVELGADSDVAVHGVDGITYFRGRMNQGVNTLSLAPGLYIVVVEDFTRRVLVK